MRPRGGWCGRFLLFIHSRKKQSVTIVKVKKKVRKGMEVFCFCLVCFYSKRYALSPIIYRYTKEKELKKKIFVLKRDGEEFL